MIRTANILYFIVCFSCFNYSWSQANIPPNLDATGDQLYCPLSQINIVTDFNIVDPDDTGVDALHIQISTGYIIGQDFLNLTGLHPNIVATWNASEGKLSLKGISGNPVSYIDAIAAVKDIVFNSTSVSISGEKHFSFTIGDANYLPSTNHYYEYIADSGITWSNAKIAAAARTYFGLQGYLATIGSSEEAQLSGEQAAGAGWLGGTDEETEGVWKWVTGPEAGTVFWNGGINGSSPNYANWNTGEPNECCGGEDYAHVTFNEGTPGTWNDLPNQGSSGNYFPQGYIVEYGGMPGDPIIDISASTKISIPTIIDTIDGSRCGSGSVNLEALPSAGTVVWFDAPTGGSQLGSGLIFNTPILNTTTSFYALVSVNGCLEGVRMPVLATVNPIPIITSTTDALICEDGSGVLSATASAGDINWYNTLIGGPIIGTGDTFTTPVITTTSTFYIDATANGCTTVNRTPVTLTVQKTPVPNGNTLQTFCDIENATIADLVAIGNNILWYDVDLGGTALSVTEELVSSTYYATQTISGCESNSRLPVDVVIYETVIPPQPSEMPILQICDSTQDGNDTNGFAQFDLTLQDSILLNGSSDLDFSFSYFIDDNYTNQIINPATFVNTLQGSQTIYLRMANVLDSNCFTDTSFIIQVDELPVIQSSIVFKNCDEDGTPDGFTDYNLNEVNDIITNGNSTDINITYYLSFAEADIAANPTNPVPFNITTASTVFARAENVNGCYRVSTIDLVVSTTSFPLGFLQELEFCDDDDTTDGFHSFNLTEASALFIAEFPLGQNLSVHYYRNVIDAQLEQNEITTQTDYVNETPFSQVLYVRVESDDNGDCFGIGPHLKLTVHPLPEFEVDQTAIYCLDGQPITLKTFNPNGVYTYEWFDGIGNVVSNLPIAIINVGGNYTVVATSVFGCESFPIGFEVVESAIADIGTDDVTIVDLMDNNTISINNTNNNLGIGDYEFALDNSSGPYQDEPSFNNVTAGVHTIYVQDKNGCGIAVLEVFVLGFPKFFTPNNDGFNDTWNIKGFSNEFTQNSTIFIYDRYGKLIKQINPSNQGWDGLFNGFMLSNSDYWFVAELIDQTGVTRTLRGHFSLIR